ncbi:hypothetical protein BLA29_001604 [Euroglyphus maynei]|uniref:Leucine rich repeat containing protein n=1 Tax=Euroglyphus maynei TaxID=6958 RepID=A0A1Y3BQI5_EURMA|nr:hypothetical protein BLA29_001604 [Euroglyphus maynei]
MVINSIVIGLLMLTIATAQSTIPDENSIHLDRNLLEQIGGENLPSFDMLDLTNRMIHTIQPGVFNETKHLKTLKLSNNRLEIIERNWLTESLTNLERLILRKNRITKFGLLAFDNLKSLRVLDIRHNRIGNLIDGTFWGLNNLKHLLLDYNHVTTIRYGWTYGLESLERLSLKFNQINAIEVDAYKPFSQRLLHLDLRSNRLQKITMLTLDSLTQLKWLDLSNNSINEIHPKSFRLLKNLVLLDLSENELTGGFNEDGELFIGFEKSLKHLSLNSNDIRKITVNSFYQLHSLITLNLSSNPIITIERESLDEITNIEKLFVKNLNLTCDCHAKWLYFWLKLLSPMVRDPIAHQLRCSRPDKWQMVSFMDIDFNDLQCFDDDYADDDGDDELTTEHYFSNQIKGMAPYFVNETVNITGQLGQSVWIECPAFGIPKPNVSLSRYDKSLKFMAAIEHRIDIKITDDGRNLFIIEPLTLDDVGYYNCNAWNENGEINSQFYLSIIIDDEHDQSNNDEKYSILSLPPINNDGDENNDNEISPLPSCKLNLSDTVDNNGNQENIYPNINMETFKVS